MNIQSNQKKSPVYLLILFTVFSLLTFTSCGEEEDVPEKLDYASLIIGSYKGTLTASPTVSFESKATFTKGSSDTEINFTEIIKRTGRTDSTTTFKIELRDLNSNQAVALRIPQQAVQGVQIAGVALKESDPKGIQGYFFYQDAKGAKLNEITFLVTANGGNYYYNYKKIE